jgi:hypothetical protein
VLGVEGVVADVADRDAVDRDPGGLGDLAVNAVKVLVDGGRLPARVGEDRAVQAGQATLGGEEEQGCGLDASAQGEQA